MLVLDLKVWRSFFFLSQSRNTFQDTTPINYTVYTYSHMHHIQYAFIIRVQCICIFCIYSRPQNPDINTFKCVLHYCIHMYVCILIKLLNICCRHAGVFYWYFTVTCVYWPVVLWAHGFATPKRRLKLDVESGARTIRSPWVFWVAEPRTKDSCVKEWAYVPQYPDNITILLYNTTVYILCN